MQDVPALRRPVALAWSDDGILLVANQASGTVSVVDVSQRRVLSESRLGEKPADLRSIRGDGYLVAADEGANEVVIARRTGAEVERIATLPIHSPVRLALSADGRRCYVSSLWARRLAIVDISRRQQPALVAQVDLPFNPRALLPLPDGNSLAVAAAYGGQIAVVDLERARIAALHDVDGHNLRGMALSSDGARLLVTHQILNSTTGTTRFSVHWGAVLKNVVRSVPVEELYGDGLESPSYGGDLGTVDYFGIPDSAAGDPGDIAIGKSGRQAVVFCGVSEVAVSRSRESYAQRVAVGKRPVAALFDENESLVYAANMFDDSISIVDVDRAAAIGKIELGLQRKPTIAERGEELFFDSTLARDGWFSCHSCHTDGHSAGVLSDNFSDGSYKLDYGDYGSALQRASPGGPKRILSLLGTAGTAPWAWNGSMETLDAQIKKSITITMQGNPPSPQKVKALAAYLKTLPPAPSLAAARGDADAAAIASGARVFESLACAGCHEPPRYTSAAVYDVGLEDEAGHREFNPPSLRGVSQRTCWFHDNRATSLREIFTKHRHGTEEQITEEKLNDLVKFLESL